ncbi:hypothetical protein Ahy_B03g063470 isoform E [Arachis hypogaea]|uniref:Uncharacterized protein n=1 Tax=Arachis hypogaea TaxID=3818 RepID=A0A444ZXA8_ARAHY|nr:hypothetical protein Ahy_B03g063470 isoform E [Arachis hypogaea]
MQTMTTEPYCCNEATLDKLPQYFLKAKKKVDEDNDIKEIEFDCDMPPGKTQWCYPLALGKRRDCRIRCSGVIHLLRLRVRNSG